MKFILSILIVLVSLGGYAQTDSVKYNWGVYGEQGDSTEVEGEVKKLIYKPINGSKKGKTVVNAPSETKTATDELKEIKEPKKNGFRVQIMLSQDKNEVLKAQSEFLKLYDDVDVYIDRKAPNYRLRVGNFYNKFEANYFKKTISKHYPTALVVSDKIDLPSFNMEEETMEEDQNSME